MRTITEQMKLVKRHKKIGLMTHVVAGYPSLAETEELVIMMEQVGVDFVEIQIPFSDPLADGPVIMQANDAALHNGVRIEDAFDLMSRLSKKVKIPLLFMGYYNSVFHYGVERFCKKAKQVGAAGLIIPDVPVDEEFYEHFNYFCNQHQLANIRVLSPSSTPERIKANMKVASGFVYCTARTGITGSHTNLNEETKTYLKNTQKLTNLPLAIGFGISKREHIEALVGHADIAVVGSAVIEHIHKKGVAGARTFIQELR